MGSARAVPEIFHGIGGHQLAFGDDHHQLAGLLHLGQDVGAEDDGMLRGQVLDHFAGLDDLVRIESAGGLIQDQNVRVVDDGLGEPDALPVALRELADDLLSHIGHVAAFADFADAALQIGSGQAFKFADELQVVADGHVGIEGGRFGQVADALLDFERLFEDVEARHVRRSRRGWQEACQDAHGGGFSGAVRTQETYDLALGNLEGNVVDGDSACVSLGKAFDRYHSWALKCTLN